MNYQWALQMHLMTSNLFNLKNPDVSIWTQCLGLMVMFQALSGFGMQLERRGDVTFMICARKRRHQVHLETQDWQTNENLILKHKSPH